MVATTDPTPAPSAFRRAVADLTAAIWRPELSVEPIPAPQRIAPFAAAITADVLVGGDEVGLAAAVQHADPAADVPILGQRAAGLAHEPHRNPLVGLLSAARGDQQRRVRTLGWHSNDPFTGEKSGASPSPE